MVLIKSFLLPTTSMSLANTWIWSLNLLDNECGTQNHFNSANLSTYIQNLPDPVGTCRDFRNPPQSFNRAKTFQTYFAFAILIWSRPGQFYETRCKHRDLALLVGFWNAFGVVVFQNVVPGLKTALPLRFQTRPSLNGSQSPSFSLDTLPVHGFLGTIAAPPRPPIGPNVWKYWFKIKFVSHDIPYQESFLNQRTSD